MRFFPSPLYSHLVCPHSRPISIFYYYHPTTRVRLILVIMGLSKNCVGQYRVSNDTKPVLILDDCSDHMVYAHSEACIAYICRKSVHTAYLTRPNQTTHVNSVDVVCGSTTEHLHEHCSMPDRLLC